MAWADDRISCDVDFIRKVAVFLFENEPLFFSGDKKVANHEVDMRGSRLERALILFPNAKDMVITGMELNHNFYNAYRQADYIQYELHTPRGPFSIIKVFSTLEAYLKHYKPKH